MIIDLITGNEIIRINGMEYITIDHDGNCVKVEINTDYDPMWGDLNLIYAGF